MIQNGPDLSPLKSDRVSRKTVQRIAHCTECGCKCSLCCNLSGLDLQQQIEELRSQLSNRHARVSQVEQDLLTTQRSADAEISKLQEDLYKLRDRYDRLFDSHKNLQRLNNSLEDKMLHLVSNFEVEKTNLQQTVASMTSKLSDAKTTICDLETENQRNMEDCNLAVQLLHCKPSNFIAQRLNALPVDLQERIRKYDGNDDLKDSSKYLEKRMIKVPMSTFPPTAMVYSVGEQNSDTSSNDEDKTVSMKIIANVLKPPDPVRKTRRTYICMKCNGDTVLVDCETQTDNTQRCSCIYNHFGHVRLNSTETDI